MTKEEIFVDREFVARKVLRNLHKYGNIYPDGHYFRGIHGRAENQTTMERPNYLRHAAYLKEATGQENDHHHFVSLPEAAAYNINIDTKSAPLYLEHWHGSPQTGYTATLEPYYLAEDLSTQTYANSPELLSELTNQLGRQDFEDKHHHLQKIKDMEYLRNHPMEYADELRSYAIQKATENGQDMLTAKAFSQVVLSEYGISTDYKSKPLFNDDELLAFEANPTLLFETFYRATDMVKTMHQAYEKELAATQTTNAANWEDADIPMPEPETEMAESAISENTEEPVPEEDSKQEEVPVTTVDDINEDPAQKGDELFAGLKIHINYIDAPIVDWDGHAYEGDTTLTGIKAYEFLVKYNQMDKELFNNYFTGCDGKSRISFEYNGYKHCNGESFQIDLGDLEFGNAQSIYEALKYRLLLYTNSALNSEREMQIVLNSHDEFETLDDVQKMFEEQKAEILGVLEDFHKEEQAFYEIDYHAAAINEWDAKPFLYLMRRSDWENEPVFPREQVKPMHQYTMGEVSPEKLDEYCVMPPNLYIDTMKKIAHNEESINKVDPRYLEIRQGMPDDMVVLASRNHPDSFEQSNFLVAIPKERIDRLKSFHKFKIKITGNEDLDHKFFVVEEQGYQAAQKLQDYIEADEKAHNDAVYNGYYLAAKQQKYHISISWDDKEFYSFDYRNGTGDLVKAFNNPSQPMLPPEGLDVFSKALIESRHTSHQMGVFQYPPRLYDRPFPSPEESRENFYKKNEDYKSLMANRPARITKEYANRCYDVFSDLAAINPHNITPERHAMDMATSMAAEGFKASQIATIAKYAAPYNRNSHHLAEASKSPEVKGIERSLKGISR